jgi:exopolysaccharide biosynthesis polyprenyl glycosylphosphotransferase
VQKPETLAAQAQSVESRVWWRDSLRRRMLAAADASTVTVFSISIGLLLGRGHVASAFWAEVLLPLWIVLAKVQGLYDRDHRTLRHLTADEIPSILLWVLTGTAATMLIVPELSGQPLLPGSMVKPFLIAFVTAVCFRCGARALWRRTVPPDRTVVIGEGAAAQAAQRKLELFPEIHARPVATLALKNAHDVMSHREELTSLLPDRVLLAATIVEDDLIAALIGVCRAEHVKLSVVPARGQLGAGVQLVHVAELPVLEYNTADVSRSTMLLKRALDILVASIVLVLVLPLGAIVALAIVLDDGRPVFFHQTRAGFRGRPFTMWKFRTMVRDAEAMLVDLVPFDTLDEPVFKLRRDPRCTRVGRLIRRFSIDELPQIVNVLKGDMSIVGPRPEQVDLVERYNPEQRVRLAVKPGVTGPMQVYGRGALSLAERIAVERDYIENMSLGRDLRILAMTVAPVVLGRGAS